jgi:hypothetical protein
MTTSMEQHDLWSRKEPFIWREREYNDYGRGKVEKQLIYYNNNNNYYS